LGLAGAISANVFLIGILALFTVVRI